jgi:uncharacterized membrane protein
MSSRTAITVNRPVEEIRRMWQDPAFRSQYISEIDAAVTFREAPGDRGTEIHVALQREQPKGTLGEAAQKVFGSVSMAKVKDDLRRFKQLVETGEVARSDGAPEGELAERKLKQRPAQPLAQSELAKAGV